MLCQRHKYFIYSTKQYSLKISLDSVSIYLLEYHIVAIIASNTGQDVIKQTHSWEAFYFFSTLCSIVQTTRFLEVSFFQQLLLFREYQLKIFIDAINITVFLYTDNFNEYPFISLVPLARKINRNLHQIFRHSKILFKSTPTKSNLHEQLLK